MLYTLNDLKTGRLSIMARPRGGDWLEDEMRLLSRLGVTVLVSLLTREEIVELDLSQTPHFCHQYAIEYLNLPILDRSVPRSEATTLEFLTNLHQHLLAGSHIAVHCRMGIGRSALIAASLLVMSGLKTGEAFERLTTARGLTVPDTDEQRAWVTDFEQRYLP